jgi:hypothetical protein
MAAMIDQMHGCHAGRRGLTWRTGGKPKSGEMQCLNGTTAICNRSQAEACYIGECF